MRESMKEIRELQRRGLDLKVSGNISRLFVCGEYSLSG